MNNRLPLLFAACLLLLFSSCKKEVVPTVASDPALVNKVNVNNLDFNYLTSKAKLRFEDKNQSLSSAISIRIKKDSAIWVSVMPAVGIEVVRALITQDSIQVINRLQSEYIATDFSFLKQKFDVEVNYEMVQALLLGNYLPAQPGMEKLLEANPVQHLRQVRNRMVIDHFIDLEQFKLQKLEIYDDNSENNILVDYQDFELLGATPFARTVNVLVEDDDKNPAKAIRVNINYNRVSIDENSVSFPFSVPASYKRK